jgi:O-antigen/teichoic acid export membrane protein
VLAVTATALVAWVGWRRGLPADCSGPARADKSALSESSRAQFWVSVFQMTIAWLPTLALGLSAGSAEVGVFAAANRVALLVGFVLIAVNNVSAPSFAALYQQGERAELAAFVARTTRLALAAGIPLVVLFVLGADVLMRVFGAEFVDGANVLRILALGQFLGLLGGPAGVLLAMSGHERLCRSSAALSAALSLVLCGMLVPSYGARGAAIAAAAAAVCLGAANTYFVWKRIGIPAFASSLRTACDARRALEAGKC